MAKQKATMRHLSYILRNETYGELTLGTPVRIRGESGHFAFRHHCVNTDTGSEWLDVFGGTPGAETLRAFRPERVVVAGRRPRRRPEPTLEDLL